MKCFFITFPPFLCVGLCAHVSLPKDKIWIEPQTKLLKSHWNSLSRSKNNTRQDHKSSVDKFLRVFFLLLYIIHISPNRINLSSEDNSKM